MQMPELNQGQKYNVKSGKYYEYCFTEKENEIMRYLTGEFFELHRDEEKRTVT